MRNPRRYGLLTVLLALLLSATLVACTRSGTVAAEEARFGTARFNVDLWR